MRSHQDVIAAFGGLAALARAIGIDGSRVLPWSRRGIPAKYWFTIEDAARSRGIVITARDLAGLPVTTKQQPSIDTPDNSEMLCTAAAL